MMTLRKKNHGNNKHTTKGLKWTVGFAEMESFYQGIEKIKSLNTIVIIVGLGNVFTIKNGSLAEGRCNENTNRSRDMDTIDIQATHTIHDDPEFCNEKENEDKKCSQLFRGQCQLYFKNLKHFFPKPGDFDQYQKCNQCKSAWKKAKAKTEINEQWGVDPHS